LAAQVPIAALNGLKKRFPNVAFSVETKVQLIPLARGGKKPPSNPTPTPEPTSAPEQSAPWGILKTKADLAHGLGHDGTGVSICVADTGIDNNHEDLTVLQGQNFVAKRKKGRWVVDPGQWDDDEGHGTHVAGSIAALDNDRGVVGVAPGATLIASKVLDSSGSGYYTDVAAGIDFCKNAGAHIINLSLGGPGDPYEDCSSASTATCMVKLAIESANAAGVKVVAAAGNEGNSTDISTRIPAGYAATIAVAASDESDQIANFSNSGLSLADVTAPGVSVLSTTNNGGYGVKSGTSMATPHASGVFALEISSGSFGVVTQSLGVSTSLQGAGLVDGLSTVLNQ
jgi:subtilisin family serine protease